MFGCPQFDLSCQSINLFFNLKRARGGGGGGEEEAGGTQWVGGVFVL